MNLKITLILLLLWVPGFVNADEEKETEKKEKSPIEIMEERAEKNRELAKQIQAARRGVVYQRETIDVGFDIKASDVKGRDFETTDSTSDRKVIDRSYLENNPELLRTAVECLTRLEWPYRPSGQDAKLDFSMYTAHPVKRELFLLFSEVFEDERLLDFRKRVKRQAPSENFATACHASLQSIPFVTISD